MIVTKTEDGELRGSSLSIEELDSLSIEQLIQRGESICDRDLLKSVNKYIEDTGILGGIKALNEAIIIFAESEKFIYKYKENICRELGCIHELLLDIVNANTFGRLEAIEDMKRKAEIISHQTIN